MAGELTWYAVVAAKALGVIVNKLVHVWRQMKDVCEHLGRLILFGVFLFGPLNAEQLRQEFNEDALHPRRHTMRHW